ncbi:MAG: hypothetical protein RJQ10_12610 [Haliea sp.]
MAHFDACMMHLASGPYDPLRTGYRMMQSSAGWRGAGGEIER